MSKIARAVFAIGILSAATHSTLADDFQNVSGSSSTFADNASASAVSAGTTASGATSAPQSSANSGSSTSSDNCSLGDCVNGPFWSVSADAVFMGRSAPDPRQIVRPTASTTTVSNASDFNPNFSTGAELAFERAIFRGNSVEVRYLGGFDWQSSANYGAVGNVQIGSFSNFGATALSAADETFLNSVEINFLHPLGDRVTLLVGARWFGLRDELQYNITFPAFTANYDWNVNNRLIGAQFGSKLALWKTDGPLAIDAVLKGGVYSDSAGNTFDLRPSTGGNFPGGATGTATSFAGEIDILASYAITKHLTVRGGYDMLWLDHVALATDQAANATANATQNAISINGNLFTYGATVGAEVVW